MVLIYTNFSEKVTFLYHKYIFFHLLKNKVFSCVYVDVINILLILAIYRDWFYLLRHIVPPWKKDKIR